MCPNAKKGSSSEAPGRRKLEYDKACPKIPVYDKPSDAKGKKKLSQRKNKEAADKAREPEHTVPWIAALTTYFSYALLIVFGTLRDCAQHVNFLSKPAVSSPERKGYGKLLNDFQDFYTRRLYNRIQDCFNRPITSAPGAWIQTMERDFANTECSQMKLLGTDICALNLASYNYLGFAESELEMRDEVIASMRRLGVSNASGRSELGTTDDHLELEARIAAFLRKPAAMVLGMGFATNSTILPALCGRGGLIISDELNHSSIVTGARASESRIKVFKHNCPVSLESTLRSAIAEGQPRTKMPWKKIFVVVEGLYSMEGDICKLREIVAVCKKYKAYSYVDEAHSIGALGHTGRGVLEHCGVDPADVDICMGTFTKSFGSAGGYIAASKQVIDYLKRVSPGHISACSMAPPCVRQASMALRMIAGEDGTQHGRNKIDQLKRNANLFRAGLERMGCEVLGDQDSPIVPVMLYNPAKMPAFSRECLLRKLAVVVVGFPATPLIKSRVRFCISAAHTEEDLIAALKVVDEVAERVMIKYKWTGRPNVAPSAVVKRQSAAHGLNVVGDWEASHFNWKDSLTIDADGRFARGNGEQGSWHVVERQGKTFLKLEWDRWPTEELELQAGAEAEASASGQRPCEHNEPTALKEHCENNLASPRRHVFRGHGNLVSAGLDPIKFPDIVPSKTSTFTLRPKGCPPSPAKTPSKTPTRSGRTPSSSYLNPE